MHDLKKATFADDFTTEKMGITLDELAETVAALKEKKEKEIEEEIDSQPDVHPDLPPLSLFREFA